MPRGQNNNRRAGMFNNGKSSSKAKKGAPDLVFSESRFLRVQPSTCSTNNPVIVDDSSIDHVAEPVTEPHEPVPFTDGSSKFFADHDKTFEYLEEPEYSHEPPPCYARGDTPVDLLFAQPMHNDVVAPYEEVMPSSPLPRDSYDAEEEESITEDEDASFGYTVTHHDITPDLRYFWQQRRAY